MINISTFETEYVMRMIRVNPFEAVLLRLNTVILHEQFHVVVITSIICWLDDECCNIMHSIPCHDGASNLCMKPYFHILYLSFSFAPHKTLTRLLLLQCWQICYHLIKLYVIALNSPFVCILMLSIVGCFPPPIFVCKDNK